jgi:hypothetical protein
MANNVDDRFAQATTTGPPGCLFGPGLIAMALIGGGIFAMSNWDTLSGFGRAGAVMLVVLGTLVLLPVALMLCVKFYVDRMFKQLMKSGSIIDANQTITVEKRVPNDDVIDAIGPGEGEHREKPPM